ncbi:hypothetical protein DBR40_17270 [Pedobacter sp. KBW01]|uniref:nuclear transport factor 2 family protein n=1 Tax=Pedobacter sp. KBW01 TaxID=2153364 RepID=UPI000F59CC8E|nr:nuclear transport factor 2 family protein [Pedobacter sp. KBW01]RQO70992.1 hypothetical protein DBR40_17270 [Pedobacter sp. KBW01]
METDLIISAINEIHKKANQALINRDADAYIAMLDDGFSFTPAGGAALNKRDYSIDLRKDFKGIKSFETSYYRIKSAFEDDVFTEKIARKSIIIKPNLLLFSKKQTIQTEETVHWKNIRGEWKVIAVEITLEEKY